MANYQISITLSGTDNASAAFKEVNKQLGELNKTSGDASQKVPAANSALNGMKTAVTGMVTAWAGMKMIDKIEEITALGDKVNIARDAFNNLNGGAGPAAETLKAMQESTGGVVDNLTLMESANKLLMMGLAGTGDEAASLTELAVKLGSVMGKDAAESVGDFAALLANQSMPRLDNFGISSGRVRQRIEELIATGKAANREEAFKLAVLEEGAKALGKLGSAADAASTPLARLQTNLDNFGQDFASRVSTSVQGIIGITEVALGQNPIQIQQREAAQTAADTFVNEYYGRMMERLSAGSAGGFGQAATLLDPAMLEDVGSEAGKAYINAVIYEIEMGADVGTALHRVTGITPDSPIGQAMISGIRETMREIEAEAAAEASSERWRNMMSGILAAPGELFQQGQAFGAAFLAAAEESGLLEQIEKEQEAYRKRQEAATAFFNKMRGDVRSFAKDFSTALAGALETVPPRLLALDSLNIAVEELQGNVLNAAMIAGAYQPTTLDVRAMQAGGVQDWQMGEMPEFLTEAQAAGIRQQYHEAVLEVERLQGLVDQGLLNDDELVKAQGIADNIGRMADEADRAAAAFENIRLSDVFGTTGGGMGGEITDMVIAQMKAAGATPEEIAAMQQALDLQSGRQTTASLTMQNQIAPMLAGMTPEQAAMAQANLTAAFQQAALMGITPDQMTNMQMMMGVGAGGQVIPGMNPQMLALLGAGQGMNILTGGLEALFGGTTGEGAGIMGLIGALTGTGGEGAGLAAGLVGATEEMANLNAAADEASAPFGAMESSTTEAHNKLTSMKGMLDSMSKGDYSIKVKVELTGDGAWVLQGGGMGQTVRDNGGSVPGTSGRTVER